MKHLILIAILLTLVGCSAFSPPALEVSVEKNLNDQTSSVHMVTRYELEEGGSMYFNPETKTWEVVLNSATTKETEATLVALVSQMMQMMMYMSTGVPPQTLPTPPPE